jgi:hypothetical protein
MENVENPLVLAKNKKMPLTWLPNGRCGLNPCKPIPHLL